jgi:hypothetical protein
MGLAGGSGYVGQVGARFVLASSRLPPSESLRGAPRLIREPRPTKDWMSGAHPARYADLRPKLGKLTIASSDSFSLSGSKSLNPMPNR